MTDSNVYGEGQIDSISSSLLEGVRRGEEQAWHRLMDMYLPLVYRWCQRQSLQDADMLDVGQEVLHRVARNLGQFRRERPEDTFRGWLRQITRNAISDHYRRLRKEPAGQGGSTAQVDQANVSAPEFDDTPASLADEIQVLYSRVVSLVRSEFSEQDWQAFYKVMVDKFSPTEVAEALEISRNQVYLAKSRIQRRLREAFGTIDAE